jgi:hypothetical protein
MFGAGEIRTPDPQIRSLCQVFDFSEVRWESPARALAAQHYFCGFRRISRGIAERGWQAYAIAHVRQQTSSSAMPRLRRR